MGILVYISLLRIGMIMMEKIIIENRSDLSLADAVSRVNHVITEGKISKTSKGKQYCFVTTWPDKIVVLASKNDKSDRFVIIKD